MVFSGGPAGVGPWLVHGPANVGSEPKRSEVIFLFPRPLSGLPETLDELDVPNFVHYRHHPMPCRILF